MTLLCFSASLCGRTGRGERGLDFRSGCYWLNWSGLFGGEFLQTDASLLEHLLNGGLLLENPLHLVLMEEDTKISKIKTL